MQQSKVSQLIVWKENSRDVPLEVCVHYPCTWVGAVDLQASVMETADDGVPHQGLLAVQGVCEHYHVIGRLKEKDANLTSHSAS